MPFARPRRLLSAHRAAFALVLAPLAGCGGAAKVVHDALGRGSGTVLAPVDLIGPARWFPVSDPDESRVSETDSDGSVRSIEHGLRLVEHPDGRLERASDVLPRSGSAGFHALPARFGGGFLFYASEPNATRVFRAATWTDRLVPLVRLPFETSANSIKVGFDRVYALSNQTHAAVAIDPATGGLTSLGALPPSPAYGGIAMADGWLAAVEVDIRGALVTFDAGLGWHSLRVPIGPSGVSDANGRVVLGTPRGSFALLPTGELARVDATSADAVFGDMPGSFGADLDEGDALRAETAASSRSGVLGARPLEVTVLRGYPVDPGHAVVLANGALARVSLVDGRIVDLAAQASPAGDVCQGVRLGAGVGFVCGEDRGRSRVYAYEPPLALEPVIEFEGPRYVAASDNGALVIRGGCATGLPQSAAYCVRSPDGTFREMNVEGDQGAERVVGLANGDIAVVVPPRLGAQGSLHVVDRTGHGKTTSLTFGSMPGDVRDLVSRGFWMDGMVEAEPGVVAGWVVGAQRAGPAAPGAGAEGLSDFVGVRVARDGRVHAGPVQSGVERAGLSARFAFVTDEHGGGFESVDHGMNWAEVPLPEVGDLLSDARAGHERGCSPVGCGVGSWLRVGWRSRGKEGDLIQAPEPAPARFESLPRVVGWGLECAPTGDTEGPAQLASTSRERLTRVSPVLPQRARASAELETSAWRPFLGVPPPELGRDDLGFDFGTDEQIVQLRGYAWGGRNVAWDRAGTWLVRVVDRFEVKRAIWSTAPSRTPWPDAASAAEVFGSDPSHRVANDWGGLYDPGGDGALVAMRTGNVLSLAVAERDRAIVMVGNADDFALDRPAGAVKVSGRWFVGSAVGPRTFHVLGIDGGTMRLVGSYPRYADANAAYARVVRTARGDALGIWVVARGQPGSTAGGDTWFVYPVDPESGEASQPLVIGRMDLVRTPRPCASDEDGWLLVNSEVNSSVWRLEFTGVASEPTVNKLEARFIASSAGLCVDALAGQVEGDPPKDLRPRNVHAPSRPSVGLALTDRASDRRWGFRCTP